MADLKQQCKTIKKLRKIIPDYRTFRDLLASIIYASSRFRPVDIQVCIEIGAPLIVTDMARNRSLKGAVMGILNNYMGRRGMAIDDITPTNVRTIADECYAYAKMLAKKPAKPQTKHIVPETHPEPEPKTYSMPKKRPRVDYDLMYISPEAHECRKTPMSTVEYQERADRYSTNRRYTTRVIPPAKDSKPSAKGYKAPVKVVLCPRCGSGMTLAESTANTVWECRRCGYFKGN